VDVSHFSRLGDPNTAPGIVQVPLSSLASSNAGTPTAAASAAATPNFSFGDLDGKFRSELLRLSSRLKLANDNRLASVQRACPSGRQMADRVHSLPTRLWYDFARNEELR